ncbi:calcium-independent phospholipase A2-gamma [Tetranychus urticae]|uniref:PNPLA domain-containing protein n=1 Tax=Tetranychus urticae TaxID=32264 RepID=T1JTZ1_TETUR|nr:calcium-independent phospholipase A2-gamma [Tetranychus urticae]
MKAGKLVSSGLILRELLRNSSTRLTLPWEKLVKRLVKSENWANENSESRSISFNISDTLSEKSKNSLKDEPPGSSTSESDESQSSSSNEVLHNQFIEWMKSEGSSTTPSSLPSQSPSEDSSGNPNSTPTHVSLPRLSRNSVTSKARHLIVSLAQAKTPVSQAIQLQELCRHLINYPEACGFSLQEGALMCITKLAKETKDSKVKAYSRQALALLGYAAPPKGRGIRILSIDGGGTKGIVMIEILRQLEKVTGKPIHQLFDLICGVSTGAILAMLLGALQTNIDECIRLYQKCSEQMFQKDTLRGAGRLLWTHAYYDTAVWEKILRSVYPEKALIETTQKENMPKIVTVSALINTPTIQPFVFRNYNHSDKSLSYYEGSCKYAIWQAIRASAAAPGYFEEFLLDNYVHQDGGVLLNNPTPVAIHEAQLLWPNEDIHVCVSIGSGKYSPLNLKKEEKVALTSLRTKISRVIDSATDTEGPHRLLQDLLKPGTYFRFNPALSQWYSLDEHRPEKLSQMQTDAAMYLRKNEYKLNKAAKALVEKRSTFQSVMDQMRYDLRD